MRKGFSLYKKTKAGKQGLKLHLRQRRIKYLVFFLEVTSLGVAGYWGYLLSSHLPVYDADTSALMILAVGAGISAFFSPCAFPMLISQSTVSDEGRINRKSRRILPTSKNLLGFILGLGLFFYLIGGLLSWAGGILFQDMVPASVTGRVLHLGVGGLLILLGLIQTNVIIPDFRILPRITRGFLHAQAVLRWEHPILGGLLFGFWYILAGFG